MKELQDVAKSVPVRVRVAVALVVLEAIANQLTKALAGRVESFVELGWVWVSGECAVLDVLYESYGRLVEDVLAAPPSCVDASNAVVRGATCVLWESYRAAYHAGKVDVDDLPSEVTEGDPALWDEFAESLDATMLAGHIPVVFLEAVRQSLTGDVDDLRATVSREEIGELLKRRTS